ncbi:Radical SAM domain protein [Solidesulfovibrio fructosivorans JJ]]|uniref:Radical SAM domain protein n=1 Tax=Solidesulfovibrio fructosivorans JJ] TaxID=596151 RepID=E1JTD2_SOLFR|nr:radical SAM/SPASM family putative metalloenzyme maturase [Solidesulfovibrio fructosivorans]EFL52392.1 Radical SAM domain protein [Solidesulfovibrio fructosivorans JJ]]
MTGFPPSGLECALLPQPSRLFVEVTSRCNLHCPMCVKHSGPEKSPEGDMAPEIFASLGRAFPSLDALILNGIGEPLLHPNLEDFIRAAKKSMPAASWVGFQTNGHLLDAARARSLVAAGLDRIFLSVDATSPELFRVVRSGGSIGRVERALQTLSMVRKEKKGRALEVGAEFVVMRENLPELPALVRWLASRGVTRLIVSHILPFGSAMADQPIFGINTASGELFYKNWFLRAQQRGIDLSQYFSALWKYNKTPDEKRLIELVQRISTQACQHDIPFHIGNLIAGEKLHQAEEVFREAEEVAAAVDLHLVLPSLRPLTAHACVGVKQGGMFIAWDGKVSPCHFLWRSFSCYLYGRRKQVAQRVFGDLSRKSIFDIWNNKEYKQFRADVLRGRYPHCPGCNVYPCEDIDSVDFENDCYGETVPCGDCLWSMGLLQCMGQDDAGGEFKKQGAMEMTNVREQLKHCG